MKRKIIQINENQCNGCGNCINICAEAALELVDGKAKLVKDFYCDGLGACLDICPVDALKIVEVEAAEYDAEKTYEHVKKERGQDAAQKVHGINVKAQNLASQNKNNRQPTVQTSADIKCGCPGMAMHDFRNHAAEQEAAPADYRSQLRQWPIQLHLLNPAAEYLKGADLLVVADCVPFAYANFHKKFLKDRIMVMFCPKLDQGQEIYREKLVDIFKNADIKSITTLHMEVPCCGGIGQLVKNALQESGENIPVNDHTISIRGEII